MDLFKDKDKDNTFYGPAVAVGYGQARTFGRVSHSGVPQETGIVYTADALAGLPAENALFALEFHQKATKGTPFTHVMLGLSAHGHPLPPSGSIGPHFDARFYLATEEERLAIPAPATPGYPAGGGFDVSPPSGYLPPNYVMNAAIAQIGRHWNESVTVPDTLYHTMVYGTWNGEFTFLTINATLMTLQSGAKISVAYPQPQYFAKHGYYPTKYNIYEDQQGRHIVSLSDFVWH